MSDYPVADIGSEGRNQPAMSPPKTKKDDDSHPLATLHLENFDRMSKEMDVNWFRGLVEQNEVIHLKRSATWIMDSRSGHR